MLTKKEIILVTFSVLVLSSIIGIALFVVGNRILRNAASGKGYSKTKIIQREQETLTAKIRNNDQVNKENIRKNIDGILSSCIENDDIENFKRYTKNYNIGIEEMQELKFGRDNDIPLLHFLVQQKNPKRDIMRHVLDLGYDPNQVDSNGDNALFAVVSLGHLGKIDLIPSAKILIKHEKFDITKGNKFGENLIFASFSPSRLGILVGQRFEFFLKNGVKPVSGSESVLSKLFSREFVDVAEFSPFSHFLKLFLEKGVDASDALFLILQHPSQKSYTFYTKKVCIDCVKLVLDAKPDLTKKNNQGETALELAKNLSKDPDKAENKELFLEIIKIIEKHEKKTELRDKNANTSVKNVELSKLDISKGVHDHK